MIKKELIHEVINYAQELPAQQDYTHALSIVMDALNHCPPEIWVTVGSTIMNEGAYRMISKMETKEEDSHANHANIRVSTAYPSKMS